MTADIVNLNKVRKSRQREDARKQAQENVVRFGRTKSEKEKAAEAESAKDRLLDGAKRECASDTESDTENPP
jgi:hypothetical protein